MKVYLDIIGCRLNQSEVEKMAGQFRAAGHEVVDSPATADLVIVNTCAVTAEAGSDSRQKIRQAARVGQAEIVVTGCWATLDPAGAAALPAVRRVVLNDQKAHLVTDLIGSDFPVPVMARLPLPGIHARTRAFIKAQDGCDNFCTFCITRLVRGRGKSVPKDEVLNDIRLALAGGVREVVLSGVNLGSWGRDLDPPESLKSLVNWVLDETPVERLRLSSLEPWDLDAGFLALWRHPRLCRHLHLPLQSGSGEVLKRMGRKTSPTAFEELLSEARAAVPGIAITTDVMVGFPGESETEFLESLEFVRRMKFAAGHVFSYSARPGTAAEKLPMPVPPSEKKRRSAAMRAVFAESAERYRARFIDSVVDVLWETAQVTQTGEWNLGGLTDNYLRVSAVAQKNLRNEISRVRVIQLDRNGLIGEILD